MTTIDPRKVNLAEKDIEDWLWENPKSLRVDKWVGRQVRVPSGIIDLLGVRLGKIPLPVVVEVKNVEITPQAILQVCRYAYDIDRIAGEIRARRGEFGIENYIEKILIFKGGVSNDLMYAANALGVWLQSFNVDLNINISGTWHFNNDVRAEDKKMIEDMSRSELFGVFDLEEIEAEDGE